MALLASVPALADDEPAAPSPTATTARQAVLDGNRALAQDNATAALEAYRHAEQINPDALEIQFDKALGHYKLGEYDEARQAFERAATSDDPSLVSDALYGVGTTYHAEAIKNREDPAKAIEGLENAIRRYQDVLADAPDHEAARNAYRKASTMRKQLKQLLAQQKQKQNQDGEGEPDENKSDDEQKQDQKQAQQDQPDDPKQKEDQKQNQEQSDKQEGDQQQSKDSDQPQDQQDKQAESSDTNEQDSQEQQKAETPEQRESNEQAERQLREMVQSMRERKKHRRQVKRIPLQPVDKDW